MTSSFSGFGRPRYTAVPDIIFDEYLPDLSEAELKALLYIFRHTYGWKKEIDAISLSQFLRGIKRKDGSQRDRGTGLSKPSLLKALNNLVERGFIFRHHQQDEDGVHQTTVYELNIDGEPHYSPPPEAGPDGGLDKSLDEGGSKEFLPTPGKNSLPGGSKEFLPYNKQYKQETYKQHTLKAVCGNPLLEEIQEELEAAGISQVSTIKLAEIAIDNGRDMEFIRSWVAWTGQQDNIRNKPAYLNRMIRDNAPPPATSPPPRPTASAPGPEGRPKSGLDFSKYQEGGKYAYLFNHSASSKGA